ncbi:hypothetical protein [Streptomyces bambusae]|uniref:Uncharacterized protein n=1 Tax=Streptomyces bambusae TaxID=1550616 RepID=A0ABS6Z4V8_9ACTN|nr:hypothetical protein [Streptomyces bambusae]MBW5482774.1 hypothetical protein [Streptomyces bambusae]
MPEPAIVYVHGNGNKVRKDLLKSHWDRALFGRDMGAASRMAYWAPLRYPEPLPDHGGADPSAGGGPAPGGTSGRETDRESVRESLRVTGREPGIPAGEEPGAGVPETPEEFVERTLRTARADAGPATEGPAADHAVDGVAEAELAGWLARMTYAAETFDRGEDTLPAPVPGVGVRALPLPVFLRSPIFKLLVERTFEDVHAYFFGGAGEAMREVVRTELAQVGDGPLVVLGHSLGSILAYEVLREEHRDVSLFVTVGSPLGIAEVQDRLARPSAVPAGVAAWVNVSDLRDLVALDHWLRSEYAPPERVTDHLVKNDSDNHHGIGEYLRSAPVQAHVRAVFNHLAGGQS